MIELELLINGQLVGILTRDDQTKQTSFVYDQGWIKKGFPLSPALPLDGNFKEEHIDSLIENLLPEGEALSNISVFYQVSLSNKFALIAQIGSETVGALTFKLKGAPKEETKFFEVPISELDERIRNRQVESIVFWNSKPQVSIAGVQEKLPIMYRDGVFGFGEGDLCSTHILKFEKKNENLILNEHLSLVLAKAAGITVNETKILTIGQNKVLLVTRFDRKVIHEHMVKRFHMIDGCQALGFKSSDKYERNLGTDTFKDYREGVSIPKLMDIIDKTKIPLKTKMELANWVVVNLCLGNSDAHGKNISFFIDKTGMHLTPFYDIMNIQLYKENYETSLAMAIGDEFDLNKLTPYDLAELCSIMSFKPDVIRRTVVQIGTSITKRLSKDFDFIQNEDDVQFFEAYKSDVLKRTAKLISISDQVVQTYRDHF